MASDKKLGTHALPPDLPPEQKKLLAGTGALRSSVDYMPLPEPSRRWRPLKHPWRIVLVRAANPSTDVTGLELHDDVVLGRAAGSKDLPDFDLSLYNAAEYGVSRRHALLRPTARQLYLIDLNSTNGTQVNSVPQEMSMARALKHNDTLSFGALHLTIKIIQRPDDLEPGEKAKTKGSKSARKKDPATAPLALDDKSKS